MVTSAMQPKVDAALARINKTVAKYDCYMGHSGGKDSAVIHFLLKAVAADAPIVHTPKTAGMNAIHPCTLEYLYDLSTRERIDIVPIDEMGKYLSATRRQVQIDGTRSDENERSDRSSDLIVSGRTINRAYMSEWNPAGLFGLPILYPIFDWTTKEVWDFIEEQGIVVSDEYRVNGDPEFHKRFIYTPDYGVN